MKNRNLLRYLAAPALAVTLVTAGCDRGLTDVNINPNEPENVPPQNLLANGIWQIVGDSYGTHGVWAGLYLTNMWSQQLAATQYVDEDRYEPRISQVNDLWNTNYVGPLMDFRVVKDMATAAGDQNLFAAAEVMSQYGFQFLTDTYGDIPYSQALQAPEITNPRYDAQRDVYVGMLTALGTAAGGINRGATFIPWAQGDILYGGNMERWFRFANSLRMRMAMRVAIRDDALGRQHFVAAYNAGGFRNNADNAVVRWGPSVPSQNPRFDYYVNQNRNDQVLSSNIVTRLQSLNDPRLPVYASATQTDGVFRGHTNGVSASSSRNYSWPGQYFLAADAPSDVMTYAEVLFLQAEAAARGWIPGGAAAAQTFYRDGIRASMQQHGIATANIDEYLAQASVAYNGLNSIHLQKYIALFMNGPEAWAEVRRTGQPQLAPVVGNQIPSRLYYPPQERLYNPDHYRVTTLFERMWWMPG